MAELLQSIENRQLNSCLTEAVWTNNVNEFMVSNYKSLAHLSLL